MAERALLLVDIQNDFCAGGALAVPDGDAVVVVANRLIAEFAAAGELIVATADWHPAEHGSFVTQHPGAEVGDIVKLAGLDQVAWPVHCVAGSKGAELHPQLDSTHIARVFNKGTDPQIDSYSGFFDNGRQAATGLGDYLRVQGVKKLVVLGLATDYCVKATALDALAEGFAVTVVADGCRAVDATPGDGQRALEELRAAGCEIIQGSADKSQLWKAS
jgi:nicotinamidase/pyrazinamidase